MCIKWVMNKLLHDDALLLLKKIKTQSIDILFVESTYFLSGDRIICSAGKMVSVKKLFSKI